MRAAVAVGYFLRLTGRFLFAGLRSQAVVWLSVL